jgi:hypothetical protein
VIRAAREADPAIRALNALVWRRATARLPALSFNLYFVSNDNYFSFV